MSRMRLVVPRLVAGLLAILAAAGAAPALEVGQKAPEFTLPASDGKPVKLSDFRRQMLPAYGAW